MSNLLRITGLLGHNKKKQDEVATKIATEASKETNPPSPKIKAAERSKASKTISLASSSSSQNMSQDNQPIVTKTKLFFDIRLYLQATTLTKYGTTQ